MSFMQQFTDGAVSAHEKADTIIHELRQQTDALAGVENAVKAAGQAAHFRRIPLQDVANAAGVCTLSMQVPVGFSWDLVSIAATGSPNTGTQGCFIYLGTNDPINLIRILDYGQRMSDDFAGNENVPGGQYFIIEFTGQTVGQTCTANVKVETRG